MPRQQRALDGRSLDVLSPEECRRLLATCYVGRLAYIRADRPDVAPLNYVVHAGAVVCRIDYGGLLESLLARPTVAFEVDDIDPTYHEGWSVIVHGDAEHVWEPEELAQARSLPLRPWAPGDRSQYIRIISDHMTGRRLR